MAANSIIGLNQIFPIYNENGTSFHDLVLRKGVVDSIVMSLGDKITGDVFYKDNTLQVTMKEYVVYNGIHYSLVNPPTIVREGMVADNGELKGMTKYSFEFYHPMYQLSNFPFTDVATKTGEEKYLSQNKTFSWIGKPQDYIDKLNKNLQGTVWYVRKSDRFPVEKDDELSEVQQFDNVSVAEAIKRGYEIWGIPYIVSQLPSTDTLYAQGKRFVVEYGLPSNEIYESESARQLDTPFVFQMGQGVGLKNNSRTPRNNKIVTRIAGYGSEDNVPYGYPQIVWTGNQDWDYTINNDPDNPLSYPIYKGIVGGQYVKLIKHPFTRTHLMPSIFTETVNKKVNPNAVGYDPTIEIKDYYDAIATQEYPYINEINLQAPSYESHEFADIKPELDADRNTGIVSAVPLNADLTPADHWDDSMDDDGNYLQSYFQITLPRLSFDLYACAAITQEMEINMRSGACIGCTFPIQVDWDDYKKNFYDEDGNFVPDGEQRDLTKYPKSNLGQISVVVQKDNSTFGTLMPNIYQQPKANDLFVFIGISLPLSYITNAEEKLDDAMKTYMLENNVYYFDYPLKFDEHFLATHTYILEQIRPNSIIHFDYGGVEQQLFVKQLTVKYGNAPLPQYDITLTDNIEVVLNQIGQVADDVEKLSSLIAILRQSYNRNVWNELAKKLSKTQDDTAQGFIRFMQGLQVGNQFVSGILGEGGVFRMNADGKVELVTDILYTRVKAYFDNVEIRDYQHTSGNRIASQAQGFKCSRVEWYDSNNNVLEQTIANRSNVAYFRCYWRVDDGQKKTDNQFIIGDLAFCQSAEVTNDSLVTNRFWRLVIGRNEGTTTTEDGEAWVDLSNAHNANGTPKMTTITWTGQGGTSQSMQALSFEAGSGIPTTEDDICQLGNVRDNTRQGAIIEYVSSIDSPTYQIFQDIGSDAANPYSLNGKNYIGLGYNTATGRAYMNVYGDMYIGAKPDPQTGVSPTYIEYKQDDGTQQHKPSLKIKANVEFTNPDSELDSFVQEHQNNYDDSWIQPALDAIQEQIDGELDTWYYEGVPTLNNLPASQWTTDDDKKKHVGDLYYDKNTGYAYRFLYDDENEIYYWTQIHDDAISEALRIASQAQDTADGKRRVFICDLSHKTPTPPYDEGDLWVNVKYPWATGTTYNDEILKCINSKSSSGSFSINDWSLANGYTAKLNNFVNNTYAPFVQDIQTQVDKKAETWYQDSDPSSSWNTSALKASHVGDIWCDTSSGGGHKTYIYNDNGTGASPRYSWEEQNVPDAVFDEIDGKAAIYVTWNAWVVDNVSKLKVRDLFIPSANTTQGGVTYKANKVYRCTNASTPTFKEIEYTDDTALNNFISNTYNSFVTNIQGQVDGKAETWRQATNPANSWSTDTEKAKHVGDLWMDISANGGNKTYIYVDNGASASIRYAWAAQEVPDAVFNKIDGKSSIFVSQPSNYKANDLWILSADTTVNGVAYKQGEVLTSSADSATYVASHWSKKVRYTDDTYAHGFDYLTSNLARLSSTEIAGGLVLSSLIGLRDTNNLIQSGINGIIESAKKGSGIAAWYGGEQGDLEDQSHYSGVTRWAKSLFRFDGSGYLAGGNITWDKDGIVTIANVYSNVDGQNVPWSGTSLQYINQMSTLFPTKYVGGVTYIDPKTSFTKLQIVRSGSIGDTDVLTYGEMKSNFITTSFFDELFQLYNNTTKINANGTLPTDKTNLNIKAMFGFWTEKYISALGKNTSGGGGGGDIDMTTVWSAMANNTAEQINLSHLTTALSGYATQAWVQNQGYITSYTDTKNTAGTTNKTATKMFLVGATSQAANPQTYSNSNIYIGTDNCLYSNGTKVLTAHQSLANYVTLNSAQTISATKTFSAQQAFTVAQGTAPFTVASTTKVTNLNADYLDGLSSASFARRVTINITDNAYRRHVVALCKLTANNVEGNSYSVGRITNVRTTGVVTPYFADVYFSAEYDGNYTLYCSLYSNRRNNGTSSVSGTGYRPCKFKYNNEWYGGVELYLSAATPYTMAFVGETNFSIFGVAYYNTQNSSPLNSEIYNSLNYTDIDETSTLYANTFNGNATSATKLKTAITLWGQSFDGSANVDGKITINHDGSAAELITLKTTNSSYNCISYSRVSNDGYHWSVGINKDSFYWWNSNLSAHVLEITNDGTLSFAKGDGNRQVSITKDGAFRVFAATTGWTGGLGAYTNDGTTMLARFGCYGSADTLNYMYMGTSYSSPWVVVTPSGDVGIGTNAPSFKFDVLSTTTDTWAARILGEQTVDSTTSRASVYLAKSSGTGIWVGVSSTTNDNVIANFQRGMTTTGSGGNPAMQIRADGSVCIGIFSATCSTAIGTTAKTATINGYTLVSGRVVRITFRKGNSVTAPTLNISSTGAKTIRQADNTALTSTTIAAGDVVDLQYDGTYYKIVGINQNIGEGYSLWVNSTVKATHSISVSKPTSDASNIFAENINRKISLQAATNGGIFDHKTSTWLLATNGTDTWLSQGNVGIGTTSPAYKLDVQGTLGVNGSATIQSWISVDRVPYGALPVGTQLTILSARSKNAGTGNYTANTVIATFGSGETGTTVNNFPVRIGSTSGATWISAGESGKTFSNQNTGMCNTENLYLTADGSIAMYTGVANDSTNYSSKLAMFINTSCNVGIGTSSPSYKLHVVGTILGTVGVFSNGYVSALGQNTSSDIRKKDIKESIALSVEDIAAAPMIKYEWKDNRDLGMQVGSIAQYWESVLPESIHDDKDGYKSMQYGVISLLSTISVARKVQDHERRIKELEKENERLRTEVEQLRLS